MTDKRPDRLSALLQHFRVDAHVIPAYDRKSETRPNLFIFHHGADALVAPGFVAPAQDEPVLVFFPRGLPHDTRLPETGSGSRFVMASIAMGGDRNPITRALPEIIIQSLDVAQPVHAVAELLLEEGTIHRCGGETVIDRLCEVLMIRLLRQLIEDGDTKIGVLAGLADPGLSRAIVSMHERPEQAWTLERLADQAAMSRTAFAKNFRHIVGVTPGTYLGEWRLTLARMELERGTSLKDVVRRTGFSGPSALSRAYKRHFGHSPKQSRPY